LRRVSTEKGDKRLGTKKQKVYKPFVRVEPNGYKGRGGEKVFRKKAEKTD